mmetsp:Transcript_107205/g.300147  ORF Transcript_107205/g.300147 Transcript_107205/m.300147 type:complete len:201 (-) Transcript_107205:205-807(-)
MQGGGHSALGGQLGGQADVPGGFQGGHADLRAVSGELRQAARAELVLFIRLLGRLALALGAHGLGCSHRHQCELAPHQPGPLLVRRHLGGDLLQQLGLAVRQGPHHGGAHCAQGVRGGGRADPQLHLPHRVGERLRGDPGVPRASLLLALVGGGHRGGGRERRPLPRPLHVLHHQRRRDPRRLRGRCALRAAGRLAESGR